MNKALCPKCRVELKGGVAIVQTWTSGTPDFPGDLIGMTISPGGPGELVECLKCPQCGHSRTTNK